MQWLTKEHFREYNSGSDKYFIYTHYFIDSDVVINYNNYRRCHLAIIKQVNKKTGVTYVYESHSDESTGEIVPTRGKKKVTTSTTKDVGTISNKEEYASFSLDEIQQRDHQILELRREVAKLRKDKADLAAALEKIAAALREA